MDTCPHVYMIYQKAMAFLNNKIVSFKKRKSLKIKTSEIILEIIWKLTLKHLVNHSLNSLKTQDFRDHLAAPCMRGKQCLKRDKPKAVFFAHCQESDLHTSFSLSTHTYQAPWCLSQRHNRCRGSRRPVKGHYHTVAQAISTLRPRRVTLLSHWEINWVDSLTKSHQGPTAHISTSQMTPSTPMPPVELCSHGTSGTPQNIQYHSRDAVVWYETTRKLVYTSFNSSEPAANDEQNSFS